MDPKVSAFLAGKLEGKSTDCPRRPHKVKRQSARSMWTMGMSSRAGAGERARSIGDREREEEGENKLLVHQLNLKVSSAGDLETNPNH